MLDFSNDELRKFMRQLMAQKGLNVNSWSKLAKKSEGTLRQFFDDPTRSLKVNTLKDYLDAVGINIADIKKPGFKEDAGKMQAHSSRKVESQPQTIPMLGYIGVGGRFFAHEGKKLPEESAIAISNRNLPTDEIIALTVQGADMLPVMRDGWIIYCHAVHNAKACLGQLCFVKIEKGGSYIRELREGRKKGSYMLLSHNGALMDDVKIEWAYPIISIEPR